MLARKKDISRKHSLSYVQQTVNTLQWLVTHQRRKINEGVVSHGKDVYPKENHLLL